jgi:hypothetical protein
MGMVTSRVLLRLRGGIIIATAIIVIEYSIRYWSWQCRDDERPPVRQLLE